MVDTPVIPTSASILDSTKKTLGLSPDYDVFDPDIIMHINTVFSFLNQIGVGPSEGFMIEDATTTWDQFVTDSRLNSIKSYIYLRVKLLFDPPATSFVLSAMKEQIQELEWRINVYRESSTDPSLINSDIIDGGSPSL